VQFAFRRAPAQASPVARLSLRPSPARHELSSTYISATFQVPSDIIL
jgi:hypothetical protein